MRFLIHTIRVAAIVALALFVHLGHQRKVGRGTAPRLDDVALPRARQFLPQVVAVGGESAAVAGGRDLLDADGAAVGTVLQTSPAGDAAIGFSGPTNLLLVCDADLQVAGIALLSSGDTRDHVAAVLRDEAFWQQFVGRPLATLAGGQPRIQTTASATLTSLAIAEAISRRLGGDAARSRFGPSPTLADLQAIFPAATRLEVDPGEPAVARLYDADDIPLGWSLRTSPAADNVIGYQGPTDTVVGFDPGGQVTGLLVLDSFDNEPYVGYVRDDWSFRKLFAGRTFTELAGAAPSPALAGCGAVASAD
jgi:NosR/NirI family nitrous oxide reductase transcriptional regulator